MVTYIIIKKYKLVVVIQFATSTCVPNNEFEFVPIFVTINQHKLLLCDAACAHSIEYVSFLARLATRFKWYHADINGRLDQCEID